MDQLVRDAWMEAVYGARLFFHARSNDETRDYWARVYRRWAQLYAEDRWRSVTW
ncbi:MAG TPA: hypothetical protein VFX15_03250 [Actinomycetes bacterium]|nr:hypothetical protein [Actinomycetes bacterium]